MTSAPTSLLRRIATLVAIAGSLVTTGLVLAGPAAADVPTGWSDPAPVDPLHVVLVGVGIPLLAALVLVALLYGPPLARGERVAPGAAPVENQWLGGPRRTTAELAAPDTEESKSGGASGRW